MPELETLRGARIGELPLDGFREGLNKRIRDRPGREKQIGHAFLLHDSGPITSPDEFARRFRHEILPLLQELAFEDYKNLAHFLGTGLVDQESHAVYADRVREPETLLAALAKLYGDQSVQA